MIGLLPCWKQPFFDQISQIAQKGVRRAAAFPGIGVNAARDPAFKKYQLSDLTMFRVIPDNISAEDANTFGVAFERKGLEQKLFSLRNRFSATTDKEVYLASVNRARNCMTHRNGRIGPEDVGEDNISHLKWWALDIYIEASNGEMHDMTPPYPEEGIFLKDGGSVMMKVTEGEILKSAIQYAEILGIEI